MKQNPEKYKNGRQAIKTEESINGQDAIVRVTSKVAFQTIEQHLKIEVGRECDDLAIKLRSFSEFMRDVHFSFDFIDFRKYLGVFDNMKRIEIERDLDVSGNRFWDCYHLF